MVGREVRREEVMEEEGVWAARRGRGRCWSWGGRDTVVLLWALKEVYGCREKREMRKVYTLVGNGSAPRRGGEIAAELIKTGTRDDGSTNIVTSAVGVARVVGRIVT